MCVSVLYMCLYPQRLGEEGRSLGIGLEMVVSHHVGPGSQPALLTTEPSLQHQLKRNESLVKAALGSDHFKSS